MLPLSSFEVIEREDDSPIGFQLVLSIVPVVSSNLFFTHKPLRSSGTKSKATVKDDLNRSNLVNKFV